MHSDKMVTTMKSLKLHGMAQAVAELAQQQGPAFKQAQPVLDDLPRPKSRNGRSARSATNSRPPGSRPTAILRASSSRTAPSTSHS